MANLLKGHRSATDFVRYVSFNKERAAHEARRTAQAIDSLVADGVPLTLEGMEILVRNMVAVYEADKRNDTGILDSLEWAPPEDVVPRDIMRTVIKDTKRNEKFKQKPKKQAAGGDKAGSRPK
jgi:hypothetical protein